MLGELDMCCAARSDPPRSTESPQVLPHCKSIDLPNPLNKQPNLPTYNRWAGGQNLTPSEGDFPQLGAPGRWGGKSPVGTLGDPPASDSQHVPAAEPLPWIYSVLVLNISRAGPMKVKAVETGAEIGYGIPIPKASPQLYLFLDLQPTSGVLYPTSGAWENARWGRCSPGIAHLPPQHMPFPGISVGLPPNFANGDPTYSNNQGREQRLEHCSSCRSGVPMYMNLRHDGRSSRVWQLQVLMALNNHLLNDVKIYFPHAEQPQAEL